METLDAVRVLLTHWPLTPETEPGWTTRVVDSCIAEFEAQANRFTRIIPRGRPLVPVLLSGFSVPTKHRAVLWYMNNLPVTDENRPDMDRLRILLQQSRLSQHEEVELDDMMGRFLLARARARRSREGAIADSEAAGSGDLTNSR